jgi:hypothetical protein
VVLRVCPGLIRLKGGRSSRVSAPPGHPPCLSSRENWHGPDTRFAEMLPKCPNGPGPSTLRAQCPQDPVHSVQCPQVPAHSAQCPPLNLLPLGPCPLRIQCPQDPVHSVQCPQDPVHSTQCPPLNLLPLGPCPLRIQCPQDPTHSVQCPQVPAHSAQCPQDSGCSGPQVGPGPCRDPRRCMVTLSQLGDQGPPSQDPTPCPEATQLQQWLLT